MSYWIFKIIWMPLAFMVGMVSVGIIVWIAKDVGWQQPFRWMIIIGAVAYAADKAVNP